ncbi:thioesterase family protein [Pseudovirgaria hyperparasitica]|uniref:Thioesterase family protein n=1 Tax=Pseudovirgaria hyperparasitica TaxID=470096 RepID=A0A6A6WJT3_9PEZI|nr:thioesterase family protein [Pseudovirgaria hyperparasitica]KAF2762530.1 thioesterase family protein [Pseudovirgaria hyperparasitica]
MSNLLKDRLDLQQQSPHTYTAAWHDDYSAGPSVHGGSIAAIIHAAASLHLRSTLSSFDQPDVHTMHVEFLRLGAHEPFTISITDTKTGRGTNFLQVHVLQAKILRAIASITSTNFDISFGPTKRSEAALHPPLTPIPDFEKVAANEVEANWLPGCYTSEVVGLSNRIHTLYPRLGFPITGVHDMWMSFADPERITSTHLALQCDMQPSLSDTMRRTGSIFDAHRIHETFATGARENPGLEVRYELKMEEAKRAETWMSTLTLDAEYKRRVGDEGLRWVRCRTVVDGLREGRMDMSVTLGDESGETVVLARQAVLVLDTKRRFKGKERVQEGKL